MAAFLLLAAFTLGLIAGQNAMRWSQALASGEIVGTYTQPVYQLEGQSGSRLRHRVRQIRRRHAGAPLLMTSAFSLVETVLTIALVSLAYWFAPEGYEPDFTELLRGGAPAEVQFAFAAIYVIVVAVLEPFYVGAGFAMYLNRRVELEAWDIEQEFRRAFSR